MPMPSRRRRGCAGGVAALAALLLLPALGAVVLQRKAFNAPEFTRGNRRQQPSRRRLQDDAGERESLCSRLLKRLQSMRAARGQYTVSDSIDVQSTLTSKAIDFVFSETSEALVDAPHDEDAIIKASEGGAGADAGADVDVSAGAFAMRADASKAVAATADNVSVLDPRSYQLLEPAECDSTRVQPASAAKVAFLFFLTHASMPERMWRAFFEGVPSEQYRIYTHINPDCPTFAKPDPHNCTFGPGSLFHGTAVRNVRTGEVLRIRTGRFSFSLVQVERYMLAHALKDDPLIDRFVLLSESSVPMWSFSAIRRAVMLQPAMVSAMNDYSKLIHTVRERQRTKWAPGRLANTWFETEGNNVAAAYLTGTTAEYKTVVRANEWGKSSQWWALTRAEACAVTTDWKVTAAHDKSCQDGGVCADETTDQYNNDSYYRQHAPDEFYFPTTIAHYGLGRGTICFSTHNGIWFLPPPGGHTASYEGETRLQAHQIATLRESHWKEGAIDSEKDDDPDREDATVDLTALNSQEYLDEFLPEHVARGKGCDLRRVRTMCGLFVRKVPYWEADYYYLALKSVWNTNGTGFPEPSGPGWPCASFSQY